MDIMCIPGVGHWGGETRTLLLHCCDVLVPVLKFTLPTCLPNLPNLYRNEITAILVLLRKRDLPRKEVSLGKKASRTT